MRTIHTHIMIGSYGFMLTGCVATNSQPPIPSSIFVDVVASSQWKAAHDVVITCGGQKLTLPAWISFRSVPNPITYGGYSQNETYIDFGPSRFVITARPPCPLTFVQESASASSSPDSGNHQAEMRMAGVKYWAVTPAGEADQHHEWVHPGPAQLEARTAAGEVRTIRLNSP